MRNPRSSFVVDAQLLMVKLGWWLMNIWIYHSLAQPI